MPSFSEILDEYHVPYHADGGKTRQGWINLCCPFCGRDPYMGYRIKYKYIHCWNCGKHSVAQTLSLLTNLDMQQCLSLSQEIPKEESYYEKPSGRLQEPSCIGKLLKEQKVYLRTRGINWRHWEVKGLGPLSKSPSGIYLGWRIYLPIYQNGKLVSWTTRTIGNKEPRYLSARAEESEVPIENCLYGIDKVRNSVVICEGPFDAISIGPGAVAIMGLNTTPAQMKTLSEIPNRVICADSEPDAQTRARKLARDLSPFPGKTSIIQLETGKDPASASQEELQDIRDLFLNFRKETL